MDRGRVQTIAVVAGMAGAVAVVAFVGLGMDRPLVALGILLVAVLGGFLVYQARR